MSQYLSHLGMDAGIQTLTWPESHRLWLAEGLTSWQRSGCPKNVMISPELWRGKGECLSFELMVEGRQLHRRCPPCTANPCRWRQEWARPTLSAWTRHCRSASTLAPSSSPWPFDSPRCPTGMQITRSCWLLKQTKLEPMPCPPMKLQHFFKIWFLLNQTRFWAKNLIRYRSKYWLNKLKFLAKHLHSFGRKSISAETSLNLIFPNEKWEIA